MTWSLCILILASTGFIGIRFIDTMLAAKKADDHSAAVLIKKTVVPELRARPAKVDNDSIPTLKAPQVVAPKPQRTKKKKSTMALRKEPRIVAPKAKNHEPESATLRQRILDLSQSSYDQQAWGDILTEIEEKAAALPDSGQANRITRLARKAVTYRKVELFLKAVKGFEGSQ